MFERECSYVCRWFFIADKDANNGTKQVASHEDDEEFTVESDSDSEQQPSDSEGRDFITLFYIRGAWKEVIKSHVQALISWVSELKFADSAEFCFHVVIVITCKH